jgi:hypothetical protein
MADEAQQSLSSEYVGDFQTCDSLRQSSGRGLRRTCTFRGTGPQSSGWLNQSMVCSFLKKDCEKQTGGKGKGISRLDMDQLRTMTRMHMINSVRQIEDALTNQVQTQQKRSQAMCKKLSMSCGESHKQ